MVVTDPSRICSHASMQIAHHETVDVPASNMKKSIAQILLSEGYIKGFTVIDDGVQGLVRINLKYGPDKIKAITGLKRISAPACGFTPAKTRSPRFSGFRHRDHIHQQGRYDQPGSARAGRGRRSARLRLVSCQDPNPISKRCSPMSRIGKLPVSVPAGVTITVEKDNTVNVQGPKGQLSTKIDGAMKIEIEDGVLRVLRPDDDKENRALHGLSRSLIHNMVVGVTNGFTKNLEIVGVGYRAQKNGQNLVLNMGYSHPVEFAPSGITFDVPSPNKIHVAGIDKQLVGQIAADIRGVRPPEPYKGKGIKYENEIIRRKEGKTGK